MEMTAYQNDGRHRQGVMARRDIESMRKTLPESGAGRRYIRGEATSI